MHSQNELRMLLSQGRHALSLGRAAEIAAHIRTHPSQARRLIEFLFDDDPGVAQRAADVLERVSHQPSGTLQSILADRKDELIGLLAESHLKKVRWNLALTVGRLPLTRAEARRVGAILEGWLADPSSIVKTTALQGLADITVYDPASLPKMVDLLRIHGRSGTPAMRARSRILLKKLGRASQDEWL